MHGMVQKATTPARKRGRPARFDHDEVIDAAVQVFWSNGVDHATLNDLERAAGVDRSTLYNSFEGRAGIYRQAAERYVSGTIERIFAPLTDVDDGIEAVIEMIERLAEVNRSGAAPSGCLIINDISSPNVDRQAADRYFATLGDQVHAAFERASSQQSIESHSVQRLTDVVVAGVVGANLISRAVGRSDAAKALTALAETVGQARRAGAV